MRYLSIVAVALLATLISCESSDPVCVDGKNFVYEATPSTIDIELIFHNDVCQIWDGVHGVHDARPNYSVHGSKINILNYGVIYVRDNTYYLYKQGKKYALRDYYK